jgi:hypothetical protein
MKWQKEAWCRNDHRRLYLFADNQKQPTEQPTTVSSEKGTH